MKRIDELKAKSAAGTITDAEKIELAGLEKAEAEKPATLDDVAKAVSGAVKEAMTEGVKAIADAVKAAPAILPSGTVGKHEVRSFREILVGIKTGNKRLIDKYELVPASKIYGDDADKKILAEGAGATGGFLVPTEQSNAIMNNVKELSIIRKLARIWPMNSRQLTVPVVSNGVVAYWIDENGEKTKSDPTFAQMVLTAYKLCCLTVVSDELLADSNPAVDKVLMELFALAIVRGEETAFLQGTGGGGDPITGIYNYAGISTVPSSGDLLDDLSSAMSAVEIAEGTNISILHAIREKDALRKLKDDDGEYVYTKPADAKMPGSIWGYPAIGDKYIPRNLGIGLNESYGIVGDFDYAHIGDRSGVVIAVDTSRYFEYDQTAFRAVKRVGFRLSDPTKFARLTGIVGA